MVSVVLVGIWIALLVYQIYKWMFYKPDNFPPGNLFENIVQFEIFYKMKRDEIFF